jgi:multiple sugar transport system permease protein
MSDDAARFGWRIVAPALLLTLAILVLPLAFSLYVSFHRWNLTVVPNMLRWVGLQNYAGLLADAEMWRALRFTLLYTFVSVAGELALGMVLALLLNGVKLGRGVFIALLVLPMMVAPIVTGLAWRLMLNPEYGPLNQMLGLQGTLWLGDVTLAKVSVIAATIWQEAPFMMVLLLAGLRSLPREPYEAALIDGASWRQSFWYITLPLLKPVIMVALLIRTIFELRAFDIVWILTSGGPAGATETLSLRNFQMSFRHFSIGPGAALSWLMLLLTTAIALWYIRALGRARRREAQG